MEPTRHCLVTSLWLGSWLADAVATDDLPTDIRSEAVLANVRRSGADRVWLALPRPGAPSAVSGLSPAVILAGNQPNGSGALVVATLTVERGVWCCNDVDLSPDEQTVASAQIGAGALTSRGANRALAEGMLSAGRQLESLGLDRAPGDLAARLADLERARLRLELPRDLESVTVGAIHRALLLADIASLARSDDGASVTAAEARARRAPLGNLAVLADEVLAGIVNGLHDPT